MVFIQAFFPEKLHTSIWGRCWCCHLSVFLTNIIELWRKCSPIGRGWGRGQASAHAARRHRGLGSVAGVVFTRCSVSYTTVGKPSRSQKSESDRFPLIVMTLTNSCFFFRTWHREKINAVTFFSSFFSTFSAKNSFETRFYHFFGISIGRLLSIISSKPWLSRKNLIATGKTTKKVARKWFDQSENFQL